MFALSSTKLDANARLIRICHPMSFYLRYLKHADITVLVVAFALFVDVSMTQYRLIVTQNHLQSALLSPPDLPSASSSNCFLQEISQKKMLVQDLLSHYISKISTKTSPLKDLPVLFQLAHRITY